MSDFRGHGGAGALDAMAKALDGWLARLRRHEADYAALLRGTGESSQRAAAFDAGRTTGGHARPLTGGEIDALLATAEADLRAWLDASRPAAGRPGVES